MFKLVKNIDEINLHNQFQYFNANGCVRGHNLKINRELVNTHNNLQYNTIRHSFFTNRAGIQETIDSSSVNQA